MCALRELPFGVVLYSPCDLAAVSSLSIILILAQSIPLLTLLSKEKHHQILFTTTVLLEGIFCTIL